MLFRVSCRGRGACVVDLAADQAGRVERRMDVRVRVALAHRANELRHLTGRDSLSCRPDDVSGVDDALERALGRGAGRLVARASRPAQECADATCDAALPEVDMRLGRGALGRLEVLVVERVADLIAHDSGSEATVPRGRLRRSLLESSQTGPEVVAAPSFAFVGERGRGQGHRSQDDKTDEYELLSFSFLLRFGHWKLLTSSGFGFRAARAAGTAPRALRCRRPWRGPRLGRPFACS